LLGPDEILLASTERTSGPFFVAAVVLLALLAAGLLAWGHQLRMGLGATGLGHPAYWGVYIANFVFFMGISMAGTFISAILRLSRAEWRRPITRAGELITVLVLAFGGLSVLADLGRPDRLLHLLRKPNLASPMLWDFVCIGLYVLASCLYLYLPLIPDIALLRDRGRRFCRLYRWLALGWQGTERQWQRLERAIGVMAVLVIPIAVSVHTVVSWIFATTVQPMWHSTMFGPYFVVGATYSGLGAIVIAVALLRRFHRLEGYIKPIHFRHLGSLLLAFSLLWLYFTLAEVVVTAYGREPAELAVLQARLTGRYAPLFWCMVVCCLGVPLACLGRPSKRSIARTVVASVAVVVGMWLERLTIVVPTLTHPRVPLDGASYAPTWVELAITVGSLSGVTLLYLLFTKLFPVVSIWEIRRGRERAATDAAARVQRYMPE
jgi:molybdopterin-containing oxidoreductase family membrane subunit